VFPVVKTRTRSSDKVCIHRDTIGSGLGKRHSSTKLLTELIFHLFSRHRRASPRLERFELTAIVPMLPVRPALVPVSRLQAREHSTCKLNRAGAEATSSRLSNCSMLR